jgi:CheY-like chemotaxis protein
MSRERILVVEDDLVVLKVLESKLVAEGYEVVAAADANEAMRAAQGQKPDLMVLDLTLFSDSALNGILDGFGLLNWLRYTLADTNFPVIIHTADISPKVDAQANACKVFAVFRKGDSLTELIAAVRKALNDHKARQPVAQF